MPEIVDLILVPYDSAAHETRMGSGPWALVAAGLPQALSKAKVEARIAELNLTGGFRAEGPATFELQRKVKERVTASLRNGHFPLTISGNCNAGAVGSIRASSSHALGLIWFDAHDAAETPDTTSSGYIDGMGLSMALGSCWRTMLEDIGGAAVPGCRTVLVGTREASAGARALLIEEGVHVLPPEQAMAGGLGQALGDLQMEGTSRVHVHLDLDVLDPDRVGPANSYALPGGLSGDQLLQMVQSVAKAFPIESASVGSYEPEVDRGGAVAAIAVECVAVLAASRRFLEV